jgi:Mn2+/Fe2+ NRAMP family transporter
MTLGGGTASTALFAGAAFGYQLLWVAPVAIALGMLMLSAVSYQTLSTGMRPFEAMRRYAGAPLAWGWALGALLASIIWHFPQYSLAAAALVDAGELAGWSGLEPAAMGFVVLAWAVALSMLYGSSPAMLRWYERLLKYLVWGIVLCFGLVVIETGVHDWGALARGFLIPDLRGESNGVEAWVVALSGLSAAVGINMVFLYPYSLLARGWGREHRRLARFDLLAGMLVPYTLATSLMVIAMANTLHASGEFMGTSLQPLDAARSLASLTGETAGRLIFDLGFLGMALSTITLHMLCAGFVASELFGWPVGGLRYRLALLLPAPGVLGSVFWSDMAVWLAVPTNIVCGFLAPLAYFGFIKLQGSRAYLGADLPRGVRGRVWRAAMIGATLLLAAFLAYYAWAKLPGYLGGLFGASA